jgi:9-cis-epoxycarotenoid dioxygenase
VVRGAIPLCLTGGAYIRNGPNPQNLPRGPHHLFDGDGMLHSLLLPTSSSSDPVLCSWYVQTYKYLVERDAGATVMPNTFSGFHGVGGLARVAVVAARVLTGQMNPPQGVGLANTNLAFFGGRLYALGESDLPYVVRVDAATREVTTHGRCDFGGRLFMGMTAHPKKDPVTGELFAFRYGPVPPFVTHFRFS